MTPDDPTSHVPSPDDDELGEPVTALRQVSWSLPDRFVARVRGRVERRVLAAESLELLVTAPLTMLLEFLRWPFELFTNRRS